MKNLVSSKVAKVELPSIRKMMKLATEFENVIQLVGGEPDFDTPEHIREAVKKALDDGYTHYTPTEGMFELREVISEKLSRENGIDADPESEIIVTLGAQAALFATMQATINLGDEVLLMDPSYYPIYETCIVLAGGIPKSVPLSEEDNFQLNPEEVEKRINPRTKAILLCNPNNPTGTVLDKGMLQAIADIAKKNNLVVISDEVYEKIIYDGLKHYSIGSFSGAEDRTVTINSFSKTYAMTGFRIGYLAAKENLAKHINKVHYYISISPNSLSQKAGLAALLGPQKCVSKMVKEYDRRRRLGNELNKIDRIRCSLPKGAFYFFPKISETGITSEELAEYLLKEAKVAVTPGSGLGNYGEGYIRISFATDFEKIKEAVKRTRVALEKFN